MESIFLSIAILLLTSAFLPDLSFSGPVNSVFIYPNFTASNLHFVDSSGTFLVSRNGTFAAAIYNPEGQRTRFYLCVLHTASNTIIWSANRDSPISNTGVLNLTVNGLSVVRDDGTQKWSTPPLKSLVTALQLLETGNLVLLDQSNNPLWQSFDYPTDTLVTGQRFPVGASLSSPASDDDLSTAYYRFIITDTDGLLQWNGLTYWKLSMDPNAYTNSNSAAAYMMMNNTGLYLFSSDGQVVVVQVGLSQADFQIAKLDYGGYFIVQSYSSTSTGWRKELVAPEFCQIPFACNRNGLCTENSELSTGRCSCPPGFRSDSHNQPCLPAESYLTLPSACNSTDNGNTIQSNSSTVLYKMLGVGIDYFANNFVKPAAYGLNLTACQDLCTKSCSCLGLFYDNSSYSCYLINDLLGSLMSNTEGDTDRLGYIKTLVGSLSTNPDEKTLFDSQRQELPLVALVLLPATGFFLLVTLLVLCFLWWRRRSLTKTSLMKIGSLDSLSSEEELEAFSIPGLPVRFSYEEIEAATNNFSEHIGAGGFGAVYKGTLPDGTLVAVKKINNLSVQGKKEFCTEIAIIGNIHHVNLVRLRGFCAQGRQRLLVYEYMNRGSLDRILFGNGPVLEWHERADIALGTARGLAYLHSGCDHKIIHCDVKPGNILLHDQFQVKISDFGLSKLLTSDQSSLFTTMRGTRGYLAPEWLTGTAISDKTDVYSYGMVLLEIVRGRRNCLLRTRSSSSIENDNVSGSVIFIIICNWVGLFSIICTGDA
uniref:Receptor-like serine/threonine-protein kinase n=1 Tax=Nelumbo nucifera TaxID=4432 RepID=A0A822Y4J5_NELNU|nr:TPA_asm: hypothetical protein HUJ06_026002 [Nelumbo nucifera]